MRVSGEGRLRVAGGVREGTKRLRARPLRFGLALVSCLAVAAGGAYLAAPRSASAQATATQPAPAQNQPPWQVNCASAGANEKLVCQMSQTLVAKNTGQRVLASVVARKPDGSGYTITLGLPHGLHLPSGVNLWVDEGEKTQHPIETADQNGSYARVELTPAMIDAMRRGTLLNVAVTSAARDEVILQLSLTGFAAAIDKI